MVRVSDELSGGGVLGNRTMRSFTCSTYFSIIPAAFPFFSFSFSFYRGAPINVLAVKLDAHLALFLTLPPPLPENSVSQSLVSIFNGFYFLKRR